MAKELMSSEFSSFVKQDKPVLVDFWATWCGPCRMLAPVVEEVSAAHADDVVVGKVDVDKCPELAQQFGVMSIPTLILFKDGQGGGHAGGLSPEGGAGGSHQEGAVSFSYPEKLSVARAESFFRVTARSGNVKIRGRAVCPFFRAKECYNEEAALQPKTPY